MKKIFFSVVLFLITEIAFSQTVPTGAVATYEFTNSNLSGLTQTNASNSSFVADRYGVVNNALMMSPQNQLKGHTFRRVDNLTFAVWVKTNVSTGTVGLMELFQTSGIVTPEPGCSIAFVNGDIHVRFLKAGTAFQQAKNATVPIFDGNWHHLALTIERNNNFRQSTFGHHTIKFYVNGVENTALAINANEHSNFLFDPASLVIAQNYNLNATLDDMYIYDRALNASEVQSLSAIRPVTCTNIVNIPDTNFKNALLDHGVGITGTGISVIDTDGDGEICANEASTYSGTINVNNKNISDLTGIEAFTALTVLACNNNQLSSLDVSANTALTRLWCERNQLSNLNVANGNNSNVIGLYAADNPNLHCIKVDAGFVRNSNWSTNYNTTLRSNCGAKKIYVNATATGNNDGTTWANAYTNLQTAINNATTGSEIWVAKGTYRPTTSNGNFKMQYFNELKLYGGFAGNETTLADRDMATIHTVNRTIISGDVSNNDVAIGATNWQSSRTDNSHKVIEVSGNDILINGVTVSGGYANASSGANRFGAGIHAEAGNFKLEHSIIEKNYAVWAAGVNFNPKRANSSVSVDACIFRDNDASVTPALYIFTNTEDVTAKLTNNLFANNKVPATTSAVGATVLLRNYAPYKNLTPIVVNNTFVDNVVGKTNNTTNATSATLAITKKNRFSFLSNPVVANNIMWGNTFANGGTARSMTKINDGGTIDQVFNSIAEDGFSNITTVTNCSRTNPNLTSTYQLQAGAVSASARDKGDNSKIPSGTTKDLAGNSRIHNTTVDIGAYEFGNTATCTNIVSIPDTNFKNALLAHGTTITGAGISVIDTDGDGEICANEASTYTGTINVENKNISDLTGIEVFTGLTELSCNNNQLTSLDVSANTVLEELSCNNNLLTSLSLPASTTLKRLECVNNQLTSLDVSANTALMVFSCAINRLTSLNVSANTALESLNCYTNQLTSLDVSGNSSLSGLYCFNNQLTSLNIANGNNTSMSDISVQNNPNLTCINIDEKVTPPNSWQKDNTANWSNDCQYTTFWSKATTGVTTDWATATNWTNGVPDQNVVTVIPSGATTYPRITGNLAPNPISNLTIESGATLTIDSSGSLAADAVTNNGTLTINSNATDSGTFEASSLSGNLTYNRYVTDKWHLIGSPVSGQSVAPFVTASSLATGTVNTNHKGLGIYDNSKTVPWVYYQNTLSWNNFADAKGYAIKRTTAGTVGFTGTANLGNVTYTGTGTATNKFEMISNPYTRYLNANTFLTSNTSNMNPTNAALYFWNDAQSRYDVYNNSNQTKFLAPGQGFFANMAATNSTFNFRANMTSHSANGALLKTEPQTVVALHISEGNIQKTTQIKYLSNTGKGLDVGYDAGYFDGNQSDFGIYTKLADGSYNTTNFMLQCVGKDTAEETVIPLGIKTDSERTITFTAEAMNLPANLKVFLEDTKTGTVTALSNGGSYKATVNGGSERFYVHTKASSQLSINSVALKGITIFKQGNNLEIKGLQEASKVVIHNVQGKKVLNGNVTATQSLVTLPKLSRGVYLVKVSNSKGSISKKVIF